MTTLPSTTQEVKELIPEFSSDSEDKRTYFAWRLCGFSVTESKVFAQVEDADFKKWIGDELYLLFEATVPELRRKAEQEIIRGERVKNHRKFLEVESRVLTTALEHGVGSLSDNQMDILKTARSKYAPESARILGDEDLPKDWGEMVLMVRRRDEEHDKDGRSDAPKAIIEAQHKEGSSEQDRDSRNGAEKDDAT